jgi:hippurate hydrolase
LLARSSEVTVTITGKSSHIAKFSEGQDALLSAARFVCGADKLWREELTPNGPCLLKFGRLDSGTARNAISPHGELLGSLRVYSEEMFQRAQDGLHTLAAAIARETGCTFDLHFSEGYPPVCNSEALFADAQAILPELTQLPEPLLIAEDFAFYQQTLPGLFLLLGTGTGIPLHADTFDFDEGILSVGLRTYERLLGFFPNGE